MFFVFMIVFSSEANSRQSYTTETIDSLLSIVVNEKDRNPDLSVDIGLEIEEALNRAYAFPQLAKLHSAFAVAYQNKSDYQMAIEAAQKSTSFYRKLGDSVNVARLLMIIGTAHKYLGHREESLDFQLQSLELRKEYGSPAFYALGLQAVGNYFMEVGEYKKCEEYYLKCLEIFEEVNDSTRLSSMYFNMGILMGIKREYLSSIAYHERALEMLKALGLQTEFPKVWNAIGYNFYNQGDFKKAKAYLLEVYQSDLKSTDKYKYCYNLLLLSRVENHLGNHQAALHYAKIGDHLANELGALSYSKEVQNLYALIYYAISDFEKAYHGIYEYRVLSDSLYSIEKEKTVRELTIKYETELKEKEIEKLTSEKKAQEQEVLLAKSEKNAYRVGIVLAVALAIAVSAFFAQRQKASQLRSMQALTERNVRIDALLKEQEVSSLNALIEGQEKERMRIAEELHDRLGSMLSAIKLNFIGSTVKKDVEQKSPENETVKTTQMLDEAVTEVRRISHNLSTGQVSRYGLVSSMDDLAARINQSDSVAMKVMHFNLEERLPVEMETGIYRITQEMLANVLKHAHASEFIVQLNKTENSVILTAEDDGIGFDYQEARRRGGIGLQNIENRVKKFGGQFSVDTAPGKGAIFTFEFPLEA